jgi:hypothetical protein
MKSTSARWLAPVGVGRKTSLLGNSFERKNQWFLRVRGAIQALCRRFNHSGGGLWAVGVSFFPSPVLKFPRAIVFTRLSAFAKEVFRDYPFHRLYQERHPPRQLPRGVITRGGFRRTQQRRQEYPDQ